jgi:16S rRNA (adenine1518-N6/adenine1519-N6)-dimethyltransferase
LEAAHPPERMVLMVQKEVASRICAKPPRMSLLACSVQFYAVPNIVAVVPKGCFWPVPKVDSAIVSIVPKAEKLPVSPERFFTVVKAGFSHPRKQLLGNLSAALKKDRAGVEDWLSRCGINPKQRAETLSVEDWTRLAGDVKLES